VELSDESNPTAAWFFTRWFCLIVALLLFLGTAQCLCGSTLLTFISVLLTDGTAAFAWIICAAALGALLLRPFKFSMNPFLGLTTAAGLGLGVFGLIALLTGLFGWLNRPIAIVIPAVSILAYVAFSFRQLQAINSGSLARWLRGPAGPGWIWLVPVVSLSIALVSASVLPGILWNPLDPHPYDVTGYHLLVPREWYERGRIFPVEHNVYSFFEMNVEMQFLLLMHAMGGPFMAMYACQFLCVGYAAMMVLAVAGTGERSTSNAQRSTLKDPKPWSSGGMLDYSSERWKLKVESWTFAPSVAAAFASTVPWAIMLAGVAYVESALMLYTALAIAWALNAIDTSASREPSGSAAGPSTGRSARSFTTCLILSGVMAGFASGVKITAVPMLLLAVPVAVFLVLVARRPAGLSIRRLTLSCAAPVLAGALMVSPWLIRNTAWAGNPLFPVAMKALGRDHFDDIQVRRFHNAHSPRPDQQDFSAKLKVLWTDVLAHWEFGYVLIPAGLLCCFVCLAMGWSRQKVWLVLICGLFVFVVWIGFTHLLPRFLVMLIPIAAIAVGQVRYGRLWPIPVAALLVAAWLGWSTVIPELTTRLEKTSGFIGWRDTTFMLGDSQHPQLIDARDRGLQIGLVGDAQAFLYPIPLDRLHYRSVFNLHTGTDDPIQAWVGPEPIGNPNWLLVINPAEIERLHRTYLGVPALPPDWAARGPEPFFLRGDELRK
jgi:hypothetical protein